MSYKLNVFTGQLENAGTSGGGGGGGVTTVGSIDTSPNANGLFISSTTISTQSASATNPGMVTTGAQTIAGNKTFTGTLINNNNHIKSTQTTPPTTTTAAAAGTAASSSVANATDIAGTLTLVTGTTPWATGVQTTVNFNSAYNVAPIVVITPGNANAASGAVNRNAFVSSTINGFSINFAVAEVSSKTYIWSYHVIETQ